MTLCKEIYQKAIERFQIPEEGKDIIGAFLDERELKLLAGWNGPEEFGKEELADWLCSQELVPGQEEALEFIKRAFRRGVLNAGDASGRYCFGSFYGRLDIFATDEADQYGLLPDEKRRRLDDWYFRAYLAGLGKEEKRPTADEVLPLEDTLRFIEEKEEQPYLALCDCRMLNGGCEKPVLTCITYRTAPNSFVRRGLAKPITKEEARQVVRDADQAGLIHTVNPGGVCSCCTDCCYLFRAARSRSSEDVWPKVNYRAVLDQEACIGCGACAERCPFGVLKMADGICEAVKPEACVGCGLCETGCPAGAVSLERIQAE